MRNRHEKRLSFKFSISWQCPLTIKAVRQLMEPDSEIRTKMEDVKEKSRFSIMEIGSSDASLGRFIEQVMDKTH